MKLTEVDFYPIGREEVGGAYILYAEAMERRGKDVYDRDMFLAVNVDGGGMCYKFEGSYLFGSLQDGLFLPIHFAPRTLREGMKMVKGLAEYDNVLFPVTDDLVEMLERLGYLRVPSTQNIRVEYGDKPFVAEKYFLASSEGLRDVAEEVLSALEDVVDARTFFCEVRKTIGTRFSDRGPIDGDL